VKWCKPTVLVVHVHCTYCRQPATTRTVSSFRSPAVLLPAARPSPSIAFPLSITGTRPPLSSGESPRGQLIMDLNAAHYPDKARAVAGKWLPRLAGWQPHSFWQVDRARHSHGGLSDGPGPTDPVAPGLLLRAMERGGNWTPRSHTMISPVLALCCAVNMTPSSLPMGALQHI